MTKQIALTRGLFALVDEADDGLVSPFKWHANRAANGKYYAARKSRVEEGSRTIVYMHKTILPASAGVVDHINGDTLDNRRENLRVVPQSVNVAAGGNPSGVFYCSITGRWAARVSFGGRRRFLGRFDTREEAIAAAEAERINLGIRRTNVGTGTAV